MKQAELASMVVGLRDSGFPRVFSATWTKKGGERTTRSVRVGVKKGVNGKGMKFDPLSKGYMPVYCMDRGFRQLNLNTLEKVVIDGVEYTAE